MALTYRIVDVREKLDNAVDILVDSARSPEDAVRQALGVTVVRSGSRKDLVARVYWQSLGQPLNMVRLYSRAADRS
jgi:hypothetical protein